MIDRRTARRMADTGPPAQPRRAARAESPTQKQTSHQANAFAALPAARWILIACGASADTETPAPCRTVVTFDCVESVEDNINYFFFFFRFFFFFSIFIFFYNKRLVIGHHHNHGPNKRDLRQLVAEGSRAPDHRARPKRVCAALAALQAAVAASTHRPACGKAIIKVARGLTATVAPVRVPAAQICGGGRPARRSGWGGRGCVGSTVVVDTRVKALHVVVGKHPRPTRLEHVDVAIVQVPVQRGKGGRAEKEREIYEKRAKVARTHSNREGGGAAPSKTAATAAHGAYR